MQKFTLYSALILGLATAALADDAAKPAVQADASATAEAEVKSEAKPETPAQPETADAQPAAPDAQPAKPVAAPAENKAAALKQSKAEALKKAAEEDPDVAARLETPYPLDGEEWKEYPLGILELEMAEAIEDLSAGKSKPPALVTQPRIISRLDLMIEELEKKTGGGGTGSSNSGNKPAEKSVLRKGSMKEGQMRAANTEGKRWADIPPKEREKILQAQGEGFPAGYEDVLADYFRKLAKSEKPAAAPPVTPKEPK